MDPLEEHLVKKAFEYADIIIEPPLKEVGGLFADQVRYWRYKNQLTILAKAKKLHEKHGISPRKIPVKTLVNLLEYSSLEEDETMQDIWANLLANATNAENDYKGHNRLIHVLKELSTEEAIVLNYMYAEYKQGNNLFSERILYELHHANPESCPSYQEEEVKREIIIVENLLRLYLIDYTSMVKDMHETPPYTQIAEAKKLGKQYGSDYFQSVQLITLGIKLMEECDIITNKI